MNRYTPRYATCPQTLEGLYWVVDTQTNEVVSEPAPWDEALKAADCANNPAFMISPDAAAKFADEWDKLARVPLPHWQVIWGTKPVNFQITPAEGTKAEVSGVSLNPWFSR